MAADETLGTSADRIHAMLSQSIVLGQLPSGERISPEELAKQVGTSITPVREALQKLIRDGLVINKPHSGFFVRSVTLKELRDALEMREILEVLAAERAATRITDDELRLLEQANKIDAADNAEATVRYTEENRHFHLMIASASGNDELVRMLGQLHDKLTRFMMLVYSREESARRHERLIEALRSHDAEAASAVTLEEMRNTASIIMAHVIDAKGAHWRIDDEKGADDKVAQFGLLAAHLNPGG